MTEQFQTVYIVLLAILALLNLVALLFVGSDKRKSVNHNQRTPEVFFFIFASLLSAPGILLGMLVFRHKIRKLLFLGGIAILSMQQIILISIIISRAANL